MRAHCLMVMALIIVTIPSLMLPTAQAWSNGGYSSDPNNPDSGTHDWIAKTALTLQTKDVSFLTTTYKSLYLLGTEAPDNPYYIGDTSKHHVYYSSDGSLQDNASALRASQLYSIALGYLKQGDRQSAAYDVGVMTHYISDVAVFGHTMGAYTDWGAEVHHSDYETEIESMKGSLSLPIGLSLGNSSAYDATLNLARNVTFGTGSIRPNVWMDAHYDFSDATFEASALASVYASVYAVASAINHLMSETTPSPTPEPEPVLTPRIPEAPSSLNARAEGAHVTLTWAAPSSDGGSNITHYLVFRSLSTDTGNRVLMVTLSGSTLSWTDSSAQKGIEYHYWVVAVNSVGQSEMSISAVARIPGELNSLLLAVIAVLAGAGTATGGLLVWRSRRNG